MDRQWSFVVSTLNRGVVRNYPGEPHLSHPHAVLLLFLELTPVIFDQPFSVARAPEGPTSSNEEKPAEKAAPSEVEREPQKKPRLLGLLFSERAPSSSSCGMENEISAVSSENGHPATTPSITIPIPPKPEVEQLQLGFLIAMPRQRTGPSTGSSYSCHLASTSKEALNRNIPSMDEWSLTDSRWTDHLGQGELPELNVGVSTVHVMVDPIAQQQ